MELDTLVDDPRYLESTLMGFTVFMVEVVGVQVRTALQYCSDMRSLYRKRTGLQLGDTMRDLADLGRRLTKLYPAIRRTRRPLLQQDFIRMGRHFDPQCVAHARLKAMLLVCFQSVSRFSDIVRCDMSDITFLPAHVRLRIRLHKTSSYTGDRFTEKVLAHPSNLTLTHQEHLSATLALSSYLRLHPPPSRCTSAPIFRNNDGSRWAYADALVSLKRILLVSNMDHNAYGLHSPRIGGATCALLDADGNELLVRTMGFWLGDSVRRYCRPSRSKILEIQRRMIASSLTTTSEN